MKIQKLCLLKINKFDSRDLEMVFIQGNGLQYMPAGQNGI